MALSIPLITEYNGAGLDKFRRELAQAETRTQKAGFLIKKAFVPATAAIGALAVALTDATKAAIEDEAAAVELARSLRQTTNATDAVIRSTEQWITRQGQLLGVADDQLRPAISRLARATGDVNTAQRLAAQAMDISVATGKDLDTVISALEKAYGGNMAALSRLAPEYRALVKDGASFEEVMRQLSITTGGAAAEAANTAEGRFRILKLQLDETKESIGASLIPVIEQVLPLLENFAGWAEDNPETFKTVALAIGAVATATVALNAAMAVNPYVAAAAGILAMAAGFEILYRKAEKFNSIGGLAARILGFIFGGAAGRIGSMLKLTDAVYDLVLPDRKGSGAGVGGLGDGLMQELKGLPGMSEGGVVTRPTLTWVGEGGEPEAVIPLSRMGNMGGTNVTINVNGGDPQAVVDALRRYMQVNGAVPIRVA